MSSLLFFYEPFQKPLKQANFGIEIDSNGGDFRLSKNYRLDLMKCDKVFSKMGDLT